jgi:hypothetical protein
VGEECPLSQGGQRGAGAPLHNGLGAAPLGKKNWWFFASVFGWFFWHMVFAYGFLFPIKELGLLTNLGHWIRVSDPYGSYMYIVL